MDEILMDCLGQDVVDAEEDAFLAFTRPIPSQSLGFVDRDAATLDLCVAGRDLTIAQSPTLLSSDRAGGTTGAVLWKVTPVFAEWIASETNVLTSRGLLGPSSTVLELGCGVSGVLALALSAKVRRYVATDQDYVLRLLRQNIADNTPSRRDARGGPGGSSERVKGRGKGRHHNHGSTMGEDATANGPCVETLALDWETDDPADLPRRLGQDVGAASSSPPGADVLVACDCVYNEALIDPFVETCARVCGLRGGGGEWRPTVVVVAQQLRHPDVFAAWLAAFHRAFRVWTVPDGVLPEALGEASGFIVHVGILRAQS